MPQPSERPMRSTRTVGSGAGEAEPNCRQAGFSLLEMVVVTAMFATVLTMSYQILVETLKAADRVELRTHSNRIGPAILSVIRRDLEACYYYNLGEAIFLGVDRGEGEGATDGMHFFTVAPVAPPIDERVADEWRGEYASVGYVLQEGDGKNNEQVLFRRLQYVVERDQNPFEEGTYTAIYERVKTFSLRFLDERGEWHESWDSMARFDLIREYRSLLQDEEGNPTTEVPQELINRDTDEQYPEPSPIPWGVEITLEIYIGDERGLYLDAKGDPRVESHYAVISLMASSALELDEELIPADDEQDPAGAGNGGAGGDGRG